MNETPSRLQTHEYGLTLIKMGCGHIESFMELSIEKQTIPSFLSCQKNFLHINKYNKCPKNIFFEILGASKNIKRAWSKNAKMFNSVQHSLKYH